MPPPDHAADPVHRTGWERRRMRTLLPPLVLMVGFALSFAITEKVRDLWRSESQALFAQQASVELGRVEDRVRAYVDTLHAVRGYVDSMPYLDADGFRQFVRALHLDRRYPEMQGVSWSRLIRRDQLASFESLMRIELAGYAPERLPVSVRPTGDRPEYLVVEYAEPTTHAPFGLDLLADPLRRPAIERARSSGTVTSVSGVALGEPAYRTLLGTGLVFWLPVYEGRGSPATAGERFQQLRGMVALAAEIPQLVRSTLSSAALQQWRVRIEDAAQTDAAGVTHAGAVLFDSAPAMDDAVLRRLRPYTVTRSITVAERNWTATVMPLEEPRGAPTGPTPYALLLALLAISCLSAWLVAALGTLGRRSEQMQRTSDTARALIGFAEDLHASADRHETLSVLQRELPKMLPDTSGAVYEHRADGLLQPILSWGTWQAEDGFAAADCQALRRGHAYRSDGHGMRCEHVPEGVGPCLCLPMNAAGELIGMLHVRLPSGAGRRDAVPDLLAMMADGVVQQVTHATANLRLREKLQEQALRDRLTGLYNRHYAMEWLEQELHRAERSHGTIGAIMIDIDHFKSVNDRHGHAAGDLVLQRIGELLRGLTRRSDVACRYGGEEFLLLLRGAPPEALRERAEQVRREVEAMDLQFQGHAIGRVTVSAGVALVPQDAHDADSLLVRADEALYAAKRLGRNRVAQAESPPAADTAPAAMR